VAIATENDMGFSARHFRGRLLCNLALLAVVATMAPSLQQIVLATDPAVITIKTQAGPPLAPGFSGLNLPQPRNGVEYFDPKFVSAVAALKPGWVRFPGGTVSLAFDWNAGHTNISWMNSLISGASPAVTGQGANILTVSQQLTQAKGGVWLSDFATFAHTMGAAAVICLNTFTDTNPGSASQIALAAQSLGLNVLEWELGNEAYLYPVLYPTAGAYADSAYNPYFTDLLVGAPTAPVGLFSAGLYTGSALNTSNWDAQLASYTPRYWNASSTHIYPITQKQSTQNTIAALNGILAHASSDYINSYLLPLVGTNTPIFVTEFNSGLPYNDQFLSYLYNGVFLAEYIARLSSVPNVKGVGVNSAYTENNDYHGLIQSANDFESYLLGQVGANPNFSTNTTTDPNTQFQFYTSAPGLAVQVANQAINNSSQLWPTTVSGGLTVNISGFDGQPVPSIYAQAYKGNDGYHYVLVTNKSAKGQNVTIVFNGAKVIGQMTQTYVSNTSAVAANTALAPNTVQIQTTTSSNPIFARPYSVTSVQW
jgi:hypothetical protein